MGINVAEDDNGDEMVSEREQNQKQGLGFSVRDDSQSDIESNEVSSSSDSDDMQERSDGEEDDEASLEEQESDVQ